MRVKTKQHTKETLMKFEIMKKSSNNRKYQTKYRGFEVWYKLIDLCLVICQLHVYIVVRTYYKLREKNVSENFLPILINMTHLKL
jgi:hypothetical protein